MLAYMKAPPTHYVLHYRRGKLRREGPGLAFFYFAPTSTIVSVPLASADLPFVVIVTTIIASLLLGFFDGVWAWATRMIYG